MCVKMNIKTIIRKSLFCICERCTGMYLFLDTPFVVTVSFEIKVSWVSSIIGKEKYRQDVKVYMNNGYYLMFIALSALQTLEMEFFLNLPQFDECYITEL